GAQPVSRDDGVIDSGVRQVPLTGPLQGHAPVEEAHPSEGRAVLRVLGAVVRARHGTPAAERKEDAEGQNHGDNACPLPPGTHAQNRLSLGPFTEPRPLHKPILCHGEQSAPLFRRRNFPPPASHRPCLCSKCPLAAGHPSSTLDSGASACPSLEDEAILAHERRSPPLVPALGAGDSASS